METSLNPSADVVDRRSRAQALLERRDIEENPESDGEWQHEKFITRARALFYARIAFMTIGLALLAIPAWGYAFGVFGHMGFVVFFGMLFYSVLNFLVVEHRTVGRIATFVTLCFDLLVLVYLIAASGGLHSPLLATQLMFTTIFVILFPKPLAILPPLLTLPVVAKIDQVLGIRPLAVIDLLILIWYSALNFITVYVIVYLNEREEAAHRDVVTLERDLQTLAVVEERSRLAREIHDGLGSTLSSLIIQSEYLLNMTRDEALLGEIRELKSSAEEAIDELRRSLQMMRDDFDLVPAVDDYCRTFSDRRKLPVSVSREGVSRPMSNDAQLTIFRVLQETLNNASKHAQANAVSVKLGFEEDRLQITIDDDGVGFDAERIRRGHYGLLNIRERAGKLGGSVGIRSQPGQGTTVTLTIPVLPPRRAAA